MAMVPNKSRKNSTARAKLASLFKNITHHAKIPKIAHCWALTNRLFTVMAMSSWVLWLVQKIMKHVAPTSTKKSTRSKIRPIAFIRWLETIE